jgi:hypothetical protein
LLIILGLAIDAFVLAGWDRVGAAHEQGELECPGFFNLLRAPWMRLGTWLRELEFVARTSYFLAVVTVLRWLIFWLVVAFAVHYSWE